MVSKSHAFNASLPSGRTYVHNFLYVLYLHWSPNPKCCLVPVKPSGPHIFKASTRSLEPVYYDVAPHAVVLLQTLLAHSSSVFFKRTREKPICSGCAFKKRSVVETTVSRSQVPPASRDNRLICSQEVRSTKGRINVLVLHHSIVRPA